MGRLDGQKIAVLATDGFEEVELTSPVDALRREGAQVEVVSTRGGKIEGYRLPVHYALLRFSGAA